MLGQSFAFAVAIIVQVISAQGPPNDPLLRECFRPPPNVGKPHECCQVASFFKEEDLKECGLDKIDEEVHKVHRHGPHDDCTKQNCLLSKNDLLNDDKPDLEKIKAFIQKWAENNPSFKEAADVAISKCLKEDLPGPPHMCLAKKIAGCTSFRLFLNCPAEHWQSNADCDTVKEHMEKCKPILEGPPQ